MNKCTIITVSNTKGGCGKSTLAFLISHYLSLEKNLEESQGFSRKKIGLLDLDTPQYTSKTFFQNSKNFNNTLVRPTLLNYEDSSQSLEKLQNYLDSISKEFDYIVIDSGGHYDEVTANVIHVADILITPIIMTLVDFNVLFTYQNENQSIISGSYTNFVKQYKNPLKKLKWYVVPNRCHPIATEYFNKCSNILSSMSNLIGFKVTSNIMDRILYSQGFDIGINLFDMDFVKYFYHNSLSITNARKEIISVIQNILN